MNVKTLVAVSFFIVVLLLADTRSASAHIPSHDPYGRQIHQSHYFQGDRYAFYCITINDVAWREKLCEGDLEELDKITMKKQVADEVFIVMENAVKSNRKETCGDLKRNFPDFAQIRMRGSYEGKTLLQVFEDDCRQNIRSVGLAYETPDFVKTFDLFVIFLTSALSYIYLALTLRFKNISSLKSYGLPLIFQIIISFASVFVGAIIQLGTKGPPIPPVHDLIFFQQSYWIQLLITGFVITLLSFALIRLALLFFKKETIAVQRRSIGIFYTLVFNPFFFPIGPILGLINLVYAKRTSGDNIASDNITLQ